jgi:MscS family membrane protein
MRRGPWAAVFAVALLLAPAVVAQETAPVLVERTDDRSLVADVGEPAFGTFRLFNLNPTDSFYVSIIVENPHGWEATPNQTGFFLAPREPTIVSVEFAPTEEPSGAQAFTVVFSLVEEKTGKVTKLSEAVVVGSAAPPRVLGAFHNPLPPPLDNAYGTFLYDLAIWIGIALVSLALLSAVVRALTARASNSTTREIVTKMRKPIFYFVLLFGLGQSLAVLPRNAPIDFLERFLVAIAVGVFGLWVLYKVFDSALFYYQREIAPRTATKVDDVVVPVLRKLGIVVLWIAGVIVTLKTLGWDPTIIFAGAGIAGLVLAFAAQDTLSNFFAGMFLMLDRPFVDGDIIVLETGEVARVESVGLRTTELYEFDHHHAITVPNTQLASRRITNYSAPDSLFKVDIFVGVGYKSDVRKVERILLETARAEPELVTDGVWAPVTQLREFAESQMTFMLRVTLRDPRDKSRVPSKLRAAIKTAFDAEGIEIPFPQRVVHVRPDAPSLAQADA